MFRRLLVRFARAVKRDSAFDVSPDVPGSALATFIFERAVMTFRGVLLSARARRSAFPVFVGRRVIVRDATCLSLSPGVTIGDNCRLDCLGSVGVVLGGGVTLRSGVHIEVTSVLREMGEGCVIDDRAGISENVFIGAKGLVRIGANSIVGPSVKIIAENHVITCDDAPIREQGVTRKGITIGEDCWIGTNAVVLDGTSVGDHAVIGAGAVVTRDVGPWEIVGGVPARGIRSRSRAEAQ